MQIWIKKNKNKLIFYLNFNFFFPKFKSKLLNTEISIKHLILIKYTTKKFKVRYSETDQMGFVHHSNYLKYFELARIEWLNEVGFSYKRLEKNGVIMPVIDAEIFFKSPAFFDDLLCVELTLLEIPKIKVRFKYMVLNQLGKEVATGSTTLAFLNSQTKRPIRCPESLTDKFQSL